MNPRIRAEACACAIPPCLLDSRQEIDEVASPRRELLNTRERRSGGPAGLAVAVATVPREQGDGGAAPVLRQPGLYHQHFVAHPVHRLADEEGFLEQSLYSKQVVLTH